MPEIMRAIAEVLIANAGLSFAEATSQTRELLEGEILSEVYSGRRAVAAKLAGREDGPVFDRVLDVIRQKAKCYAGLLSTNRAGINGYPDQFEQPRVFPGRMAQAAKFKPPLSEEIQAKPWMNGILRRLIFISDMGDALSKSVPFDYLLQEVINPVLSPAGQRHLWLWLTKRPGRMAQLARYLKEQGIPWPGNLMAMTTVTSQSTAGRIKLLRNVPSQLRGLSVEPLFGPVKLDLSGIDWVIVGGGSDVLAEPFHVEWALDLRKQCQAAGVAFFLKQLGKNPYYHGQPLKLRNRHGGDWDEWPAELRIREFPTTFYAGTPELKGQNS